MPRCTDEMDKPQHEPGATDNVQAYCKGIRAGNGCDETEGGEDHAPNQRQPIDPDHVSTRCLSHRYIAIRWRDTMPLIDGRMTMPIKRTILGLVLTLGISSAWAQGGGQTNPMYTFNQALSARVVTKSDTTVLVPTRALSIGDATACDIAVIFLNDTAPIIFHNRQSGSLLPFSVTKVMSADTTCSDIVVLY